MRCKGNVHPKGAGYHMPSPCSRNAWKDGYCKTHHPKEKYARSKARWREQERKRKIAQAKQKAEACPYCGGSGLQKPERSDVNSKPS